MNAQIKPKKLEITEKDRRRLKKIKIGLMRNPKFALYSGIMMIGKTSIDEHLPTAMTNGRDETYGLPFMRELNDKELGFVVLHENLHKAFRHMSTWIKLYKENPALANAACDFVINLIIVRTDPDEQVVAMPRKDGKIYGCLDEKYAGMNAKQVFDLLKKEQKEQGGGGTCSGNCPAGDGKGKQGEGNCTCQPQDIPEGFDEHDWEGAKAMDETEVKELEREVDRAIRQGQIAANKIAGSGKGYGDRLIGELMEPKIDWREILREFMTSTCVSRDASSWRRPNRRFLAQDVYMPTLVGESIGRVVFGIDMSGSISATEATAFLTEAKSVIDMVHPDKVDIMYWGSSVVRHEEYDTTTMQNMVATTKPQNAGGTSPSCFSQFLIDKNIDAECIIVLTDGYVGADWGNEWKAPLLWVIWDNSAAEAEHGKTIHVEAGDM